MTTDRPAHTDERGSTDGQPHRRPIWEEVPLFDARLHALGSWNTTGTSYLFDGTADLIRLTRILPGERWCSEEGILQFLDEGIHRQFLRWVLHPPLPGQEIPSTWQAPSWEFPARRIWSTPLLRQKLEARGAADRLPEILHFLTLQEMLQTCGPDLWVAGPALAEVRDLGSTMEWLVQAHLRNQHGALTRRRVSFTQWAALGLNDLDLLAFTDQLVVTVETKSNTSTTKDKIARFAQRAQRFPADVALLLVDTSSPGPPRKYAEWVQQTLGAAQLLEKQDGQENGQLLLLHPNIYIANTAQGIQYMLDYVLAEGLRRKQQAAEAKAREI